MTNFEQRPQKRREFDRFVADEVTRLTSEIWILYWGLGALAIHG